MSDNESNFATVRLNRATKKRLDDEQDFWRRKDGKKPPVSRIVDAALQAAKEAREQKTGTAVFVGHSSADQRLLDKIATMIQTGDAEKLPIIRLLLKGYEPPEPPKIPPPGEKHEAATKEAAKQSTQHRRRAG